MIILFLNSWINDSVASELLRCSSFYHELLIQLIVIYLKTIYNFIWAIYNLLNLKHPSTSRQLKTFNINFHTSSAALATGYKTEL